MSPPVLSYVLAGGRSRRFGSDKARALLHGEPLIVRVARGLSNDWGTVTAVADRPDRYADLGLRTIADRRPGGGPLAGLEAALADRLDRQGPGWIVLACCDLTDIRPAWLDALRAALSDTATAVAFRGDRWQPFPGAYHTRLLPMVADHLHTGPASFQRLLSHAAAMALPLPANWPTVPGVNTPEALARVAGRKDGGTGGTANPQASSEP